MRNSRLRQHTGFTLIETIVAIAIFFIIFTGAYASIAATYEYANSGYKLNMAKNAASYTVEYLRSRTVTRQNNWPSITDGTNNVYAWYNPTTNPAGAFPCMVDITGLPLQSSGHACHYYSTYVETGNILDGGLNPDDGSVIRYISCNPSLANQTFSDNPLSLYSSMQGYCSLQEDTLLESNVFVAKTPEDGNLQLAADNPGINVFAYYADRMVKSRPSTMFPLFYVPNANDIDTVRNFTAGSTYQPIVIGNSSQTDTSNKQYDPHYTTNAALDAPSTNYSGFRILTRVVARTKDPAFTHVQYYDVIVTVFWMTGTRENRYELNTQIAAY